MAAARASIRNNDLQCSSESPPLFEFPMSY